MRAVVSDGVGRVRVAETAEPALEEDTDAIVRVTRTAICGSDLHFFHGKAPIEPGEIMGHEATGVVVGTGRSVGRFSIQDRVVVSFDVACGECWFCRRGQSQLCEEAAIFGAGAFGGGLPGAQARYMRVPKADVNLLRIPDAVDDDAALFTGDVLTTGYHAASLASAAPDEVVAVLGCGPVGFFAIQSLRALGVAAVIGIDPEPARLALAERAGAIAIDPRSRHPEIALEELTDGRGADVAIDAVGSPDAFRGALELVRRGGSVVVVGMYAGETTELQLGVAWARALNIRFSGLCPVHAVWERTMEVLAEGRLDPRPLISHRLPLEDAVEGYRLFDSKEATKVLLIP
jgi:2-desacetyl-2-hydroxyethyl bacteriochlorophyllide A dehydrogenase